MQMTSDIAWSGADCTPGVTPRQLVQSSSENDTWLTVIVDDHSRAIAGYFLSLDAPSALNTA
ncbi:MAG TPA: hypothetical protein VF513_11870, partial [Stenotrophomonas sp.]